MADSSLNSPALSQTWRLLRAPTVLALMAVTFPISIPLVINYRWRHGRFPRLDPARVFEKKKWSSEAVRSSTGYLWTGRKKEAVAFLEDLLNQANHLNNRVFFAARGLAARYEFDGDTAGAQRVLDRVASLPVHTPSAVAPIASLRSQLFMRMGQADRAREVVARLPAEKDDASMRLVRASVAENDTERLELINSLLRKAGLCELSLADPSRPLEMANLTTRCSPPAPADCGMVSVIFPIYNAEDTVATAVRSVCAQSYRNLEILLVDDCSTDDTLARLHELATEDPRIRVIESPGNGGAYAARNLGAAQATGRFLTTHDADDWSHPEKIARQIAPFSERADILATGSHWVRTSRELRVGYWKLADGLLVQNHSSFLTLRSIFEEIGPWDTARVSSDGEYICRLESLKGRHHVKWIGRTAPLSFGLADESSLTNVKTTHVSTIQGGLRCIYRGAYRYVWATKDLPVAEGTARVRALSPRQIYERRPEIEPLDLLLVGDCRNDAVLREMAKRLAGKTGRFGLLHEPEFLPEETVAKLGHGVFELAEETGSVIVSNAENYQVARREQVSAESEASGKSNND